MATASRSITVTQVDHVSVMAYAPDIKSDQLADGLSVVRIAGVHIYLDTQGIDALVEQLTPYTSEGNRTQDQQADYEADAVRTAI